MANVVTVYVAGVSYTNNPAGTGGSEFTLSESGAESDAVWYQVDRSIVREAILGEDIRKGYLDISDRGALDQLGVIYQTREAVEGCGLSNYILWLKEEQNH